MLKKMTIEDLAVMVQRGFQGTGREMNELKGEIKELHGQVKETKKDMEKGFNHVDVRFNEMDVRLGRIEKLTIADHKHRIERLEGEVKDLKNLLAV